jgi:hypothetical protein
MSPEKHEELVNHLVDELTKLYPRFKRWTSGVSSINDQVTQGHVEFGLLQDSFYDTDYNPETQSQFIHYTSIQSFFNILHTGDLRLHDLNSMNDPFEFDYPIKKMNILLNQEEVNHFKKSLFITSFCAYDEGKDDFDMWRLYGKNGEGVGIVFELTNPTANWYNIFLGKVQYGDNNEAYKTLQEAIRIYHHYVQEKGLSLKRMPQLIGIMMMLHKNEIWQSEKEYRLGTYVEYDDFNFRTTNFWNPFFEDKISFYLRKSSKVLAYLSYPLKSKMDKLSQSIKETAQRDSALSTIPILKIAKVITGYNVPITFDDQLNYLQHQLTRRTDGDRFKVQKTPLAQWFK